MQTLDDRVEGWYRIRPEKRLRLMFTAYKHYFRSSVFPWLVVVHLAVVCGLIYFFVWFHIDQFNLPFVYESIFVGALCGLSGTIHLFALRQYILLKYNPYYRKEIEGVGPNPGEASEA